MNKSIDDGLLSEASAFGAWQQDYAASIGMLMDFGTLKNIIKSNIIDEFDHSLVINQNASAEFVAKSHDMFGKMHLVPYQPTIENMLEDFAERIKKLLPDDIQLFRLMLRETVTSYAEWFAEDNME